MSVCGGYEFEINNNKGKLHLKAVAKTALCKSKMNKNKA